jgi:hypothetical protein
MSKKRGNPNWCRPVPFSALLASPSSFESLTQALRLTPEDFRTSVVSALATVRGLLPNRVSRTPTRRN